MSSRFAALASLVVLTAVCALAQIGFPGSGPFPGQRRYPGQQPYPGQQQQTTNFVGQLESISGTAARGSFVIQTDDRRTVTVTLEKRTKFINPSGKSAKIGDFQPGDHIEVDCTQDNNDNYRAMKVTQLRIGTAEDRADAAKQTNVSAAGTPPNDSDDPDRPHLHRADSPDSGNNSTSRSNSDGRPTLLSDNSASSIDTDSDSSPSSRRRRAVSSADDKPGAQISARGATSEAAANSLPDDGFSGGASRPASRNSSSDPARPVLARNSPPPSPEPPPQLVRNSPPPQAPSQVAPTAAPSAPAGDVLAMARRAWSDLPSFTATQVTTRAQSSAGPRASTWKQLNTATTDFVYKASADEFAAIADNVLSPSGGAELRNQHADTLRDRAVWRYDFSVPLARSRWHIASAGQSYSPGFSGSIWIEQSSGRVLRLQASADELPSFFPLNLYETSVDYDLAPLGSQSALLPSHSESVGCQSATKVCTRTVTDFREYRVQ